jgi:heme A synthase
LSVPSTGYRRLALGTAIATFLLIVVGGIVRVSGSGLGCGPENSGFHGWPFCNGDVVPGVNLNSAIEYSHRTLASVVAIVMIAMAVIAWRRYRTNRALVWSTTAASGLIVVQGLLGAATVEEGLDKTLVATHLGLAMALLALALYAWRASASRQSPVASRQEQGRWLRPLAIAASAAVLCTIVAGGYMAGTQKYGRPDYQLGDGAHHACGKQFPACNGEFMPFGKSQLVDIHLAHRAFMYLATILLLALILLVLRRRPSQGVVRSAYLLGGLLVLQILLGALNVWLGEHAELVVAHLAVGTLLWVTVAYAALELVPVPASEPGRVRDPRPEASLA